jgi:hypothetical protein
MWISPARRGLLVAALVLLFCCGALLMACSSADDIPTVQRVGEPVTIDGLIAGYGGQPVNIAGAKINLAHDGSQLYIHVTAAAAGWIAVGFNEPNGGMDGANLIVGMLTEIGGAISNDLGRGTAHSPAAEAADFEAVLKTNPEGLTMEFAYPMQFPAGSGFALAGLRPGDEFTLLVAYHQTSTAYARHTARGALRVKVSR